MAQRNKVKFTVVVLIPYSGTDANHKAWSRAGGETFDVRFQGPDRVSPALGPSHLRAPPRLPPRPHFIRSFLIKVRFIQPIVVYPCCFQGGAATSYSRHGVAPEDGIGMWLSSSSSCKTVVCRIAGAGTRVPQDMILLGAARKSQLYREGAAD